MGVVLDRCLPLGVAPYLGQVVGVFVAVSLVMVLILGLQSLLYMCLSLVVLLILGTTPFLCMCLSLLVLLVLGTPPLLGVLGPWDC